MYTLYLLQAIFAPLQGAINAVVYGLNRKVRKEWCRRFWIMVNQAVRSVHGACREEKKHIGGEKQARAASSKVAEEEDTQSGIVDVAVVLT